MLRVGGLVPAPVIVEFERVVTQRSSQPNPQAEGVLAYLLANSLGVEPFTAKDAETAAAANARYGTGNRRGGTLNLIDLMVYAMARRLEMPILCTGRDFTATDVAIHPASRRD